MNEIIYRNILEQLDRQLNNFFIDVDISMIAEEIDAAYERCMVALSASNNKYLNPNGIPRFSLEHSGCWSIFLYYLSNCLKNIPGERGADKIYYLNKILHSVEWYSGIELPKHFVVEHPLGSVLGRADYGDYLAIYQGVTIGGNITFDDENINSNNGNIFYPVLGEHVLLFSNAKVLGNAHIGNDVIFSANSCVINEDIPDHSIVFGATPNLIIKHDVEKIEKYMRRIWRQN